MVKWKKLVVGVDGSDSSRAALRWAYDVALQHGSELTVLSAWRPVPPPPGGMSSTFAVSDDADPAAPAEQALLEVITAEIGDDPAVIVRPQLQMGRAAKVLIEASATADLLVVGSRGIGGFAGMLLGSVSQHVAAHAACTVVVVR
jgi:nucleotide-binding universal stress UspA family protein